MFLLMNQCFHRGSVRDLIQNLDQLLLKSCVVVFRSRCRRYIYKLIIFVGYYVIIFLVKLAWMWNLNVV